MLHILKIFFGMIVILGVIQPVSAQSTSTGSDMESYTNAMLFVVILLIAAIFFVLIFHSDGRGKIEEKEPVMIKQFTLPSPELHTVSNINISGLYRTAFIATFFVLLIYLIILILILKNGI